jgi:hypothetical protein
VICKSCSAGTFAPAKETACIDCETGKFQELAAAIEYQCKFCDAGTEFTGTTTACDDCATGKFQNQNDAASASCKFCAAGKRSNANGVGCTDCVGYNLNPADDCKPMSEMPIDYQNHQCCQNCASAGSADDCVVTGDGVSNSVSNNCGCMSYQHA